MKIKNYLWSALAMMVVFALSVGVTSCKKDDPDPDEVSVGTPMVTLVQKGESKSINIMSNTKWTVSGAQSWLQVTPMQGSGNGFINVTANENTGSPRSCTLTVQAGDAMTSIMISQDGRIGPTIDDLVGDYTGTLKPIGYSDDPARCYVSIEKLSNDAVRISRLLCEEFSMDMNPVNMLITINNDGSISLRSETSYSIEGTYFMGQLTLSFANSVATWSFTGTKN